MEIKNCIRHKLPETREEWLKNRLNGVGGADVGAILGFNPYCTPYKLWLEKTCRLNNDEDSEAMRQGRDLEDYVAKRFEEATGKKVYRSGFSYQSQEHLFMLANVDRLIVGENAGLECKTASALTRTKYDKGDVPASYYAQCMHYMAVTGAEKWYLAVVVLGKGFHWYEVNRDEEEIKALIEAEQEFWDYVVTDTEPPVDGSEITTEALGKLYSEDNGQECDLFGRNKDIETYLGLKQKKKELEEEINLFENLLKHDLGEFQRGHTDNYTVTWKSYKSKRVDSKKLEEKYPQVYADVLKTTESRRFSVREIGGE